MTFEQQIHAMFDHIWDCEIEHPVFQDTVGELMEAVIQCYKNTKKSPLADIKPKEIPTMKRTYEYHGDSKKEEKTQTFFGNCDLSSTDREFITCEDCKRSEGKKMDKSITKQVITTWYDPSKKVPPNSDFVVATVSGKVGEITLDHELMIANWVADEGWYFYDEYIDAERDSYLIKVDAWCDLKPYRGEQ